MSISNGDAQSSLSSPVEIQTPIAQDFSSLDVMPQAVTFSQVFGEWLKRTRKAKKLNQEQLAERAKMSQGNVSEYERGQKNMGIELVDQFVGLLETDVSGMLIGMLAVADEIKKRPAARTAGPAPVGSKPPNLDTGADDNTIPFDPTRFPSAETGDPSGGDKPVAPPASAVPKKRPPRRPSPSRQK